MDRRRFITALIVPAVLAAILSANAGATGEVRYYFHSGGVPVNQVDSATFNTEKPAGPAPALATATRALGTAPPAAWTGTVASTTIRTLGIDFWQKAPVGEGALGGVDYDVTITVGGKAYVLPTLTSPADVTEIPSHVTQTYAAGQAGVPLPISAAGDVTIEIRGHFDDAEAGALIVYDSTDYPSGFVVNAPPPPTAPPLPSVLQGVKTALFRPIVGLPGSLGFGEPSIHIAPRHTKEKPGAPQTIYVSAPRGTTRSKVDGEASPMWRSDDGGKTWVGPITPANVGPVETSLGGGDTDIKTDKDGNLYMVDLWLGNDTMAITQDKGESWIGSPVSHQHFADDRQWLAYSAKENAMYMDYDGFTGVYLDKADLNGPLGTNSALFFQKETLVEDNQSRGCICSPGSLFVDDSRSGPLPYLYMLLASSKGIDLVRSDDGGSSFSHHYVPKSGLGSSTGNAFEVGGVDAKGNVYVAWVENRDGHFDMFFASSPDHGQTWRGPFNVSALVGPDRTAMFPALAAEANGHVALAFYGSEADVDPGSAPSDTSWNVYFAESRDAAAPKPTFDLTLADPDFHRGQICGDLSCDLPPGQDRSLADFFSIAFDDQHMANVIYTRGSGGPETILDLPPGQPSPVKLAFLRQTGSVLLPVSNLSYAGPSTLLADSLATFAAKLVDRSGNPVKGAKVSFRFDTFSGTATTDANGIARVADKLDIDPGRYELRLKYFGDGKRHRPASVVRSLLVKATNVSITDVAARGGGGEPSIAVGPEGNLYVSWPADGGTLFSRSTDGGNTWTAGAVAETSAGDTTVNVDPSGAVYESNLRNIEPSSETLQGIIYKSFDGGTHWSQRSRNSFTYTATNSPTLVDRQWVDVYQPPGHPTEDDLVYIGYHDFATGFIFVNASRDGGVTFGERVSVVNTPDAMVATACNSLPVGLQVVKSGPHAGRVYVSWLAGDPITNGASACGFTGTGTLHNVYVAWSDDRGATWTDQLAFEGELFTDNAMAIGDMTLDDKGNPYITISDNLAPNPDQGFQWDVYVLASFDGGKNWNGESDGSGTPYRVTTGPGTRFFPSIVAGEPGKVDVAYIGTDSVVPVSPTGSPLPGGDFEAEWRVYMAQTLDLRAAKPAWKIQQLTHEPMHIGDVCTIGIACTPGEVIGLEDRDLLDFIDIAVDDAGMAHIAYADDTEKDAIRIANQIGGAPIHRPLRTSALNRFSNISLGAVASRGGGGEPSITVGPEGNIYVSWPGDVTYLSRSQDGGRSWKAGGVADQPAGDTTVNVDRSGAVYESDLRNVDGSSKTLQGIVFKSFDHGDHWPQVSDNAGSGTATNSSFLVDRQWVDVYQPPGKKTNQTLVYISYHDIAGPGLVWVNVSKDGGKTFGPQTLVVSDPVALANSVCNTIPGGTRVVQSGPHAGRVYVAWLAGSAATNAATGCNYTQLDTFGQAWIAWSDDQGATWANQLVYDARFGHDASALFADLTLDNKGNPYVTFAMNAAEPPHVEDPSDQWDVFVTASFDDGKTWNAKNDGAPYKVTTSHGTHFFPTIAAGDPGKVDIAYIATDAVVPQLPYGKPAPGGDASARWYVYMAQSLDLRSGHPTWNVSRLRSTPIHVGDVCTLGIFCTPGQLVGFQDRELLDFIDIATDADGMAHVAYTDNVTDEVIRVANQTTGASVVASGPRRAIVKGTKTTKPKPKPMPRTLPATGVGDATRIGLMLMLAAALTGRRLRRA